jgi:hypothetical protein
MRDAGSPLPWGFLSLRQAAVNARTMRLKIATIRSQSTMLFLPSRKGNWLPSASKVDRSPVQGTATPRKVSSPNAKVIRNLMAVQHSVSQLTKQQAAAPDGLTNNSTDDLSEATPKKSSSKSPSNRTNAALTRQPKKASK